MAELKKYLDTTALGTLVDQIKAEDAKVLAAAKKYTDEAPFDASGSAATAEQNAKDYADEKVGELANGAVKANTDAIAVLNGEGEGSVKKAVADAKTTIDADVDAVEAIANQNKSDIAAINNETTGILAQAKADATEKANAVQANVDAVAEDVVDLAAYVGTIPESATATDIVGYVQEKTAGIATDAALGELQAAVDEVEADVAEIAGDYLKASDKTELEGKITVEAERAAGAESGLASRIKAIEDDYLVEADKTELSNAIALKADKTALDAEKERAEGVEESLQNQINTIMNNPDAEGAINSINEFTQYVADHGTIADGMRTDINKNKDDIAAMDTAYKAADSALSGRLDTLEAINHEAYVAADTALKNELNGEIAKKADSSALTSAVETLEAADEELSGRLDAVEAQLGDGENSVSDLIATAKQEAIDAAAADAASKDAALETALKKYADEEDAKIESRVDALEAASATHALASDVTALAGRVTTAEGEIDTLQSEMDAVEALAAANKAAHEANAAAIALKASQADLEAAVARIAKNEGDIVTINGTLADKADSDDLDAAVARIAKNETDIAANTSAINSFTAITSDEVNALFA